MREDHLRNTTEEEIPVDPETPVVLGAQIRNIERRIGIGYAKKPLQST